MTVAWYFVALAIGLLIVFALMIGLPFLAARERKIDAQRRTGRDDDDAS